MAKQQKPKFAGVPQKGQSNVGKKGKKFSKGAVKNAMKGGGLY
jgi:hypothetical protein